MKDSNLFVMPHLNSRFFLHKLLVSTYNLVYLMAKVCWCVVEKNYAKKAAWCIRESSRKNILKSPSARDVSWIFFQCLQCVMRLLMGMTNWLGVWDNFKRCEMVRGEGARQIHRHPIANYLKGLRRGFVSFRSLIPISSFLHSLPIVQLVSSFFY